MSSFELPASFAQRRFWWLDRLDPGLPTYNVPWSVEFAGPLDIAALRAALQAAVDRHEALRSTLRAPDGDPVQVVPEHAELAWRLTDLSASADPVAAATARMETLARVPFDLEQGPLLRADLLRLGPQRHWLVLVCHHAIGDMWSFNVLFEELVADYTGEPVAPPPIQYADFAAWQAQQTSAWAQSEEYFRGQFDGAPVTLEVAGVRPRPARASYLGRTFEFAFPAPLAEAVRTMARAAGTTVFTVLLSAFATLVGRMAGRTDVLVGIPVSGRLRPETERVVGLFANTLPLRVRPRPDVDFATLVDETRIAVAGALVHQELPFDRIVEMSDIPRDINRSPLIQVFFQYEEMPPPLRTGELTLTPIMLENGGAKFDISMGAWLSPEGVLLGSLNYATDLYDEAWADAFLAYYLTLIGEVTSRPTATLSTVDYLSAAERERVTAVWPAGAPLPAGPDTAIAALSDAAVLPAVGGDAPARIAGALRALGVGPESRVGIHLARDERLIPAVLGVWWVGAAYVPLDPAFPPARLAAMVADAGVSVILGDAPDLGPDAPAVRVLPFDEALRGEPAQRLGVPAEAAAYTIFTSGSTGRPKGVTVTQGNVATMLRAFSEILPLDGSHHLVAVTTLAFDISVLELLLPALCGARVTVADAETAGDAMALRKLLENVGATALQATPATWRALVVTGGVPPTVALRLCGGEALPRDLAEALTTDGATVFNVYGPTETTVWSAAGLVLPGEPVRVGPPIPGTRIYILDDLLRPVPTTVTGQVFIGGPGVARGYHGNPALTARRFIPDPFSTGGRLYATGDLGRWMPDGRVELLGRNDHQVKIRGFRIELGEAEAVLREHPAVDDAVVVVRGEGEASHLAAFVTLHSGSNAVTVEALREHAARSLPAYLVPSVVAILDRLPLNASGKVDRAALPDVAPMRHAGSPPQTPTEVTLAQVWCSVLGIDAVAREDDFFAVGGNSLAATRLLFRVRETFGTDVSLRDFYAATTLAACARVIDEVAAAGVPVQSIGRVDRAALARPAGPR